MDNYNFKNIEIEDKSIIESFTSNSDLNICDFAFSNMFGWGSFYNLSWTVIDNALVMRFFNKVKNRFVYMPIVSDNHSNAKNAIDKLLSENGEVSIVSVTPVYKSFLENFFKNISFEENRNSYDYIYDIDSLKTLSGKKLQSKRNHVNKFKQLCPDYKVVEITDDNIDQCIELEKKWLKEHINTESREVEQKMICSVLKNRKILGLLTLAIEVEGKIVAFSAGSPINRETFGVHIEKADSDINGSFATINKEFCNRIPQNYKYVNREEDMGIDGLRKSKLSYNPHIILPKDIANIKL